MTISSAGHAAWIADTGRICVASHFNGDSWTLDPRWPTGNLFHVGAGEAKPTVINAPGHRFNHVSVSRRGKYFVCDSYPRRLPDKIALVVGNPKTGRWRPLLNDCLGRKPPPRLLHRRQQARDLQRRPVLDRPRLRRARARGVS